jgi:AcrR family transcriptional regulator
MNKGAQTKQAITRRAITLASKVGLEKLTIGNLAKALDMSKSGLFAHFSSKEGLQLNVMEQAVEMFTDRVGRQAIKEPRGEPRVRAIFKHWLDWENSSLMPGGCIFVGAAAEFDDCPGAARDFVANNQQRWLDFIAKAAKIAVEEKHFRKDLDTAQFAYEFISLLLGYHQLSRLLKDPKAERRLRKAFEGLLERSRQ